MGYGHPVLRDFRKYDERSEFGLKSLCNLQIADAILVFSDACFLDTKIGCGGRI
jgi:hypothetical protein